jgi:PKD repeat protein
MKRLSHIRYLFRTGEGLKNRFQVRNLLMAFAMAFLFCGSSFAAQDSEQSFYIIGHVTNLNTGEPVQYQLIYIESDTAYDIPGYFYAEISTNENGFYKVSVPRPNSDIDFFIYTYDCHDQLHDTLLRVSEGFVSQNQKYFVDFNVCETTPVHCDPNFFYVVDSTNSETTAYQFFDDSGEDVSGWMWDFGDGAQSISKNSSHAYDKFGLYEVKLTIVSNDIFGNGCTDSITKMVNVGGLNYYSFGGQIFDKYFPIENGKIMLYEIVGENIVPIDTTYMQLVDDTWGYYFYMLPEAKYMIKSTLLPSSPYYGEYIPTYYGDVAFWDQSAIIDLEEDNFNYDIHLLPNLEYIPGDGLILGNISYFDEFSDNDPAYDIQLVLSDSVQNFLAFQHSNVKGEFRFGYLPWGKYIVQPDLTGFPCLPIEVIINEENPVIDNLDIVLSMDTAISINEYSSEFVENVGEFYPNPFDDIVQFEISLKKQSNFQLFLFNQLGQTMVQKSFHLNSGQHVVPLNLKRLPDGYYTAQIVADDKISFVKKILKLN